MDARITRTLRDLNLDDLIRASGTESLVRKFPALARLLDPAALVLARRLAAFDHALGPAGGSPGWVARTFLADLGTSVATSGTPVVTAGPRLFVANHPGLGDVLALLAVLDSPDLKVVARDRPFLRALPNLADRLILVPEHRPGAVLGRVIRHLCEGGAVLSFPAGRIEADPAWRTSESWEAWSASTPFWVQKVPGLLVQPCLVAGVRCRGFVDPWWARWRGSQHRDWTAAVAQLTLQVLFRRPRRSRIEVWVGEPLTRGPEPEELARWAARMRRGQG
jgi:hypothetical protein